MDQKHAIAALERSLRTPPRTVSSFGDLRSGGLPAGVIAERLGVDLHHLSFHLAQLTHAGLITQRRQSRHLIYSAEYGAMTELLAYLTENCCGRRGIRPRLCNPADAFVTGDIDEAPARSCIG